MAVEIAGIPTPMVAKLWQSRSLVDAIVIANLPNLQLYHDFVEHQIAYLCKLWGSVETMGCPVESRVVCPCE